MRRNFPTLLSSFPTSSAVCVKKCPNSVETLAKYPLAATRRATTAKGTYSLIDAIVLAIIFSSFSRAAVTSYAKLSVCSGFKGDMARNSSIMGGMISNA